MCIWSNIQNFMHELNYEKRCWLFWGLNCKPISVGRPGDVKYTTPLPHPTAPSTKKKGVLGTRKDILGPLRTVKMKPHKLVGAFSIRQSVQPDHIYKPQRQRTYIRACAHSQRRFRSDCTFVIRIYAGRILDSQKCNVSVCGRLGSDCMDTHWVFDGAHIRRYVFSRNGQHISNNWGRHRSRCLWAVWSGSCLSVYWIIGYYTSVQHRHLSDYAASFADRNLYCLHIPRVHVSSWRDMTQSPYAICGHHIWDVPCENVSSGIRRQQRPWSDCAFAVHKQNYWMRVLQDYSTESEGDFMCRVI